MTYKDLKMHWNQSVMTLSRCSGSWGKTAGFTTGSHGAPWQLLEHLTVPSVDGGQREREKRLKKASLLTFFEFSTSSSHLVNCALFRSDAKQRAEM